MQPTLPINFGKDREDGFTFVELLVVLATLALLAVTLLPALAGTKPSSQAFQCLENQRQLTLAWQMYAQDNGDLLPPNDYPYLTTYATMSTAQKAQHKNWVVGTMAYSLDAADELYLVGQVSELLDPNTLLSPYITNRTVYHCPADNYVDPFSGHKIHVRSYSMNAAVGTVYSTANGSYPIGSPVGQRWLNGSSYSGAATGTWLTYGKMTSFTRPGPANTFVFMDENPRTINDGSIAISANATAGNTYLIDLASGNHNGANPISFADGHMIIHKWQDPRTYTFTPAGQGNITQQSSRVSPDDPDCFYLAPITSAAR